MLDWLDTATPKTPPNSAPPGIGHDSGEVRSDTIFPVSRFPNSLPGNAKQAGNPRGYWVFPVSRFSRLENEGGREINPNAGNDCEGKGGGIPEHLPDLLDAMAATLDPAEVDELRSMAAGNPEQAAEVCRLILAAPPFPTAEDAAELDRLIVRICDLEPWLVGYLPEMQAARLAMAPARYPLELSRFRRWVREAEAKAGRPTGGRGGETFAL